MASQSNPYDFFKDAMKGMNNPFADRASAMETHKKNIETLTEANKMAVEVMRSVSELQQQYLKQAFENMSSMMKDVMTQGMSEEAWKKHTENLKQQFNHSVDHGVTVASMVTKSQKAIYDSMKEHVGEHMKEAVKKASQKKH